METKDEKKTEEAPKYTVEEMDEKVKSSHIFFFADFMLFMMSLNLV